MALLELWDEIEPSDVAGRLVLVPAANPSAFRAGERRNPEDPLDMNRIFPAARTERSPTSGLLQTRLAQVQTITPDGVPTERSSD
jgi:predicted deacylase